MSEPKRLTADNIGEIRAWYNEWPDEIRNGDTYGSIRTVGSLLDHIAWQDGEIARLTAEIESFRAARGDEDTCPRCGGVGRRAYANTATWRGGSGGQAITEDVCDVCWGSGVKSRTGPNLRQIEREIARLKGELQAAGKREVVLREALARIKARGLLGTIGLLDEDMHRSTTILMTPASVYAQRAQMMSELVAATRDLVGYWETHEIIPMIHRIDDALAALDDVEGEKSD